ncbi:hypothetical protein NV391_06825 [Companilactobacillus crustorum]|uniref:hypothetical protein n=1 Tax=Companilactobacillus crustorum TaxID=392416 RepID=UPI00237D63A1|nr:hypothetical protein [Companilactobacillus crustorum]WDT64707.1 hypothetical protein NV391_06825 [Companilactobacillus crustorum]
MKPVLLNDIEDYPNSGLGRITTATNQDVHEVLNSDYTYTFDMLVTDSLFKKVKEEMIVATSVSVKDTDFFYIKKISTKNPGTVTVTCNHVTMLTNENYVRGKLSIDGKSAKAVLNEMVNRLDLPGQKFSYSTDIDKTIGKTDIVYTNYNPGQILVGENNSLVSVLDARLVRKGMSLKLTSKNTGRYIDLRHGKNIAGVQIDSNIDNLVTSIIPYYTVKAVEVKDDKKVTNTDGWTFRKVNQGGTVTIGDNNAIVYDDKNVADASRGLAAKTDWTTDIQRTKGDVVQYRVATNMWVDSKAVTFNGELGDVIDFQSPTNANDWTVKEITDGVVTIGNHRAKIYSDANTVDDNRLVEIGSSWYTDKQRTKDGMVEYRIATNQWVNANDVDFKGKLSSSADNGQGSVNTDGWTIKRINSGGVVTVTSSFGTTYDDNNTSQSRGLGKDSQWSTDQVRTKGGTTQYRVATNMWIGSGDVSFNGTVGSVISGSTASPRMMMARMAVSQNLSGWTIKRASGTFAVNSNGTIYNDEGSVTTNRMLAANSKWATDRVRSNGSDTQYRVATDMWVSISGNSFDGKTYEVISEPKASGTNTSGWTIKSATGSVKIVDSMGLVYDDNNVLDSGRGLAIDSQWAIDKEREKNGLIQYEIATNMWVNATNVSLNGSIGGVISKPVDPGPVDGWIVREVKNGVVTVGDTVATIYLDSNDKVTNRGLAPHTPWVTDRQRHKDNIYEYRVATNMWVLSSDISFKGELGKVISGTEEASKAVSIPEHLQYGPEVYSPLFYAYKLPHRKYVDYSSRVENIPDLIDVSSKYFIENPDIDKPAYTINITVANANQKRVVNAQIGDIARIYDPKYEITSDETIVERHFDPDLGINKSLKAGTVQQTIFRYLDKRIKDASQKTDEVKSQTTNGISNVEDNVAAINNDVSDIKDDAIANKDETNQKLDESEQRAQDQINNVKNTVSKTQSDMTNFMNGGGNNKIRWIPTLAEATQMEITTPYGYWLLDDHGAGFHSNNGTVMTGLSADGRVYADSITGNTLTGTNITGGTITGGVIKGAQIFSSSLKTDSHIQVLNSSGAVSTSIASYGISTPSLTVDQLDGVNMIHTHNMTVSNTANIQYLHVMGNIVGNGSGLYLGGPVYVDGRRI